jgi:6-phosphofructokinase 1
MSKLIGNAIFGQSGGPTSVINASAAVVFTEALKQTGVIDKVMTQPMASGILKRN